MAAKKGRTGSLGMVAFIAVILTAVAFILIGLEAAFHAWGWSISLGRIPGIIRWVAEIMMTIVIIWASYDFAEHQSKFWRVVWWILAIIAILSVVGLGGWNSFK